MAARAPTRGPTGTSFDPRRAARCVFKEGQDWGLPAYDFARLEQEGFSWLTARTRRARQLYDLFRIDHVVGYFRQWIKPRGAQKGHFDLSSERVQEARGRAVLTAMVREAGPGAIVAEDLGVIPHWVRGVMRSLSIPGYRVLPWERDGDVVRAPVVPAAERRDVEHPRHGARRVLVAR